MIEIDVLVIGGGAWREAPLQKQLAITEYRLQLQIQASLAAPDFGGDAFPRGPW